MNPFRPLLRADTYRVLLFLAAAIPVGAAVLGVLIAGWVCIAVLVVTPLVVPVLVVFRALVGLLARAEGALARSLLGVDTHPPITSGGRGFWGHGKAVLADPDFWKQQAYLAVRMTIGCALAIGELSLIASALGAIAFPAWYRWSDLRFGSWLVDTFARSLVLVPAGLVTLAAAGHLMRPIASASRSLAGALLDGKAQHVASTGRLRGTRRRALRIHAGLAVGLGVTQVVVWALSSRGYFWPEWVLLPLALLLAIHGWAELVERRPRFLRRVGLARGLALHLGVSSALVVFLTLIWAVTSRGYFWPAWVLVAAAIPLGIHAVVVRAGSQARLARRVEALETTRAGAVDAQDAELRRIERDLHDGAQARLVALGMSLGMAKQKFGSDLESARKLVAEARAGVAEALRELRDLARGIHPPVLSDRGLGAALSTLADRSPVPTIVSVSLDERPASQIETAAYFVAAEALANAAKHSGASRVAITVARRGGRLEVEITDDGRGGADPSGSGLVGLRQRVEALDGALAVTSPEDGPTTVRAQLPCA